MALRGIRIAEAGVQFSLGPPHQNHPIAIGWFYKFVATSYYFIMSFKSAVILLLAISAIFYLVNLGQLPLDDYDEAIYAQVVRETLENGNWLDFTYFSDVWIDKPPFHLWLMALSAKFFGLNEFALRLPGALSGIAASIFIFLIIRQVTKSNLFSLAGGAALTLWPLFSSAARDARLDVPVAAAVLSAIYFYLKGLESPKFLSGVGVSIGIGLMIKSVFGLLALPFILFWSMVFKNWHWLKNRYLWLGVTVGSAVALPWHLYEGVKFSGRFWSTYFGFHVIQRLTDNVFHNQTGDADYLFIFWRHGQPWSLLFLAAAILVTIILANKNFRRRENFKPLIAASLSSLAIFAAFLAVPSKLMTYLVPAYPLMILAVAFAFWGFRGYRRLTIIFAIISFIAAGALAVKENFISPKFFNSSFAKDEKEIGIYLDANSQKEPIFVLGWPHHQSLRYYSGQEIEPLVSDGEVAIPLPFWLVISNLFIDKYAAVKELPQPYSGEYLTLVHFSKK